MGNAYPTPGLTGKFYDADMVALVEVVRDTVGRHDTFALACNAKYYEDMGYPGHVNCTDNFNVQVEPYAIAARKGWPALNFFFNTAFNADNILVTDEPWSRPGDYVLLRALTDLVCASSACPDDVDAANAWDPTDIHVRVYGGRSPVLEGDRPPRDARRRGRAHEEDDVPSADRAAHAQPGRVRGLLAAHALQRRGRDRGVLGLPRRRRR